MRNSHHRYDSPYTVNCKLSLWKDTAVRNHPCNVRIHRSCGRQDWLQRDHRLVNCRLDRPLPSPCQWIRGPVLTENWLFSSPVKYRCRFRERILAPIFLPGYYICQLVDIRAAAMYCRIKTSCHVSAYVFIYILRVCARRRTYIPQADTKISTSSGSSGRASNV